MSNLKRNLQSLQLWYFKEAYNPTLSTFYQNVQMKMHISKLKTFYSPKSQFQPYPCPEKLIDSFPSKAPKQEQTQ